MAHDFAALYGRLFAAMVRDYDDHPPPEMLWGVGYVDAIDRALNDGSFGPLLTLMREGQPIHPMLLPALAAAITSKESRRPGRRRSLSGVDALNAAREVNYLRFKGQTLSEALDQVASRYGSSASTIERAYDKHIPAYRRPAPRLRKPGRF